MQARPSQRQHTTITEQARRAQIVAAAIETIVALGYPRASFARIAERAGLSSTGLISYHFRSKQALDQTVVADIMCRLSAHMEAAMRGADDPQAALVAYIEGLIGFMQADPHALQALLAIVMHGGMRYDAEGERAATSALADILRRGQAEGVFRDFDVGVMTATIQRALDGIPLAQLLDPTLDLDRWKRELVETFTQATRRND